MEVAFFSDSYLPTRDGVAIEVSALARELRRRGHGVTVFAPHSRVGAPSADEAVDGIKIVRCRSIPVPLYGGYRWALFPFLKVAGRDFGSNIDVVHAHTPGFLGTTAFFAARRYHLPLVGTFHTDVNAARENFGRLDPVRLFLWAATKYSMGIYWRCDVATAPSAPARETLERLASRPFRHPIEVVPNGIEIHRFRRGLETPDWRARCGFGEVPLLTYLGRLTRDKGIHRYLDALAALPAGHQWAGVIAGTGPEEASVRERLRNDPELRARVRYLGPVLEEEKPALLSQSDLFVLPSTSDTSSIAVLEAMASGAACVVSNVGGPAAIVEDGRTGRIVPVEEEGALARSLLELVEDPSARARLGRGGAEWVRREASIEVTARRFISLYELLRAGGGPSYATGGS
jgi:glycosyltransferase involved in cell wall biosynthesis